MAIFILLFSRDSNPFVSHFVNIKTLYISHIIDIINKCAKDKCTLAADTVLKKGIQKKEVRRNKDR